MADLQPLLPRKIQPLGQIGDPPPAAGISGMDGTLPPIVPLPTPGVSLNTLLTANSSDPLTNRSSALSADLYKRENPIAPTTTLGKIGHVASRVGNVLGDIFAPDVMANVPGTQLYNERIEARDKADLDRVSQLQTAESGRKQQAATTAYTEQRPAIEQAKILQKLTSTLAPKGIKATMNPDGTIDTEDDQDSQAFKDRVALDSYRGALQERAQVQADNQQNHYLPGTPQFEENQRKLAQIDTRLQATLGSLGIQRQKVGLQAERLGLDEDKTYNPQPTAQERTKGDLAQSAVERVQEMKQIVAKHPEYFGPVAGRATNAQAWIGSSDPDAVRYNAAAQYLADHSAGVFGGRGQYITQALHGLTDPKYTPGGLNAALDEAEGAAKGFVAAGTTHGKGVTGHAASASQPTGVIRARNANGVLHEAPAGTPLPTGWKQEK